jgi:LCP family protein required for cell wall assembly
LLHFKKRKRRFSKKANNVLIFLLVFITFLVVFGGICLWAVIKINEERRSSSSSPQIVESDIIQFDDSDVRNLLIVTTDQDQAQGFIMVHSDPARTSIRSLAIPRDTVVDYKTSEIRIYELYKDKGVITIRDALAKLLGINFDNYIVMSYENIEKLVDYLELGIIIKLDENLNYNDNKLSINIDGGLRTLTSSQVVKVLRYPAWHGGRKQRADIQAQLTAALINQYMRPSRESMADKDFRFIVNLAHKKDILVSHFAEARDGLAFLAGRNDGNLCKAVSLPGEYQGSGDAIRYYASDDIKQRLPSLLR